MTILNLDTMEYFDELKNAGFTEAQAKALIRAIHGIAGMYYEIGGNELAIKKDIRNVQEELKRDIQEVRREIQNLRRELKQ